MLIHLRMLFSVFFSFFLNRNRSWLLGAMLAFNVFPAQKLAELDWNVFNWLHHIEDITYEYSLVAFLIGAVLIAGCVC